MSDTDKPLAGIVLSQRSDNPDIIGGYFGPSVNGVQRARGWKSKLDEAGVPSRFIMQNKVTLSEGKDEAKEIPMGNTPVGIEIENASSIADFVAKGGMYSGNDTLKGFAFETRPGMDSSLTYRGKNLDQLRQTCETQGILFKSEADALVINDPYSITIVAASGGTFAGSARYLPEEPKKS